MFNFFRKIREKVTPLDLNNPDAVVIVTNIRYSQNPFGKNYRGCCLIKDNYLTSLVFQTLDGNTMLYEQPHRCYVNFLSPKVYPYTLWAGRKLELYEGKYLVGTMEVEEIKNPLLDRNAKFKNKDDILSDCHALNVALSHSIEWGKKFNVPLYTKIMKSLPDLSGVDIEKLLKYVDAIRDDVYWNIYFPNWDVKKQDVLIDAQKVVSEKYPWIDEENLNSLHSHGMYYAWHG